MRVGVKILHLRRTGRRKPGRLDLIVTIRRGIGILKVSVSSIDEAVNERHTRAICAASFATEHGSAPDGDVTVIPFALNDTNKMLRESGEKPSRYYPGTIK